MTGEHGCFRYLHTLLRDRMRYSKHDTYSPHYPYMPNIPRIPADLEAADLLRALRLHLSRLQRDGMRYLNVGQGLRFERQPFRYKPSPESDLKTPHIAADAVDVNKIAEEPLLKFDPGLSEKEKSIRFREYWKTKAAQNISTTPNAVSTPENVTSPSPSTAERAQFALSETPASGADRSKAYTLPELHAHWKHCQRCALGKTRQHLVFGVGNARPQLLFIGEGPGADEDQQGEPFVGQAGQILSGLIKGLGLTRDDVYITNVVKCRPPNNRNPAAQEIAQCAPLLAQQIELLNPALIVTLGNIPLKALYPDAEGITKARGKLHQYRQWPLLPTFHPSYILRNWNALPQCWQDLRQALAQVQSADWLPKRIDTHKP